MDSISDEAVIATNDDASMCKYQAVSKGYYTDKYLDLFLSSKIKNSSVRKAPEINRGYFARSASIAYLVEKFINSNQSCQIVNLGAGYDSLYWRLRSFHSSISNQEEGDSMTKVNYVEIDMSPVVLHKMMAIKKHSKLSEKLNNIVYKGEELHSDNYHLISSDLRQVEKEFFKQKLFNTCHLDPVRPTLCIAECVLVYMPTQDSASLISWFSHNFEDITWLNYEQCNMDDRFGNIMLENMNARHCDLMGVDACKSLESQIERFISNGLEYTKTWTLSDIYEKFLPPAEVERIEKIEFLDEKELLEQLLQHYCIVLGSQRPLNWILDDEYWLAKTL